MEIGAPPLPFFSDLSNCPPASWPVSTIFSSIISPQSLQIISPCWSSYVRFTPPHSGHLFIWLILFFIGKVYKGYCYEEYLKLLVFEQFVDDTTRKNFYSFKRMAFIHPS